jgi:hypothetical protein
VPLTPTEFHGDWNYTVHPKPLKFFARGPLPRSAPHSASCSLQRRSITAARARSTSAAIWRSRMDQMDFAPDPLQPRWGWSLHPVYRTTSRCGPTRLLLI